MLFLVIIIIIIISQVLFLHGNTVFLSKVSVGAKLQETALTFFYQTVKSNTLAKL